MNSEEVITEEDFKQKMCAIECSGPAAAKLNTVKFNDKVVDVDSVHRVTDKIQMMPLEKLEVASSSNGVEIGVAKFDKNLSKVEFSICGLSFGSERELDDHNKLYQFCCRMCCNCYRTCQEAAHCCREADLD